ncbi:neuromedin-U isoform X1 [Ictalurus punctatus]|uniref:Neuromedin-U isoform X1 n=1 Tax=Ictalurus punctatus TaxID=7998 RepID=A0A2D0PYJ2_ICTPU|nr:neuromedin-U isoform X1 [Ictalurus punctatus]
MKTNQWRKGAWESASSSMSPSHSTILAFALLLISAIPPCTGAPVFLDISTTENDKLLNQIDNVCSSLLPEERPLRTLDTLWDLCDLMQGVLQKSEELAARETTKRFLFHYTKTNTGVPDGTSTVFHPLLQLIPQLHSRRGRRVASHETPRMIHSRGYFSYRPRNGRRSTEYV